ncbi:MAG: aldo/keto reductase [Bacteroidales bacterium]|nr:aldo/keto reductase [Bacteroidales bacterium]
MNFSRFALGFWRLNDWNFTSQQLLGFVEKALDLGVTTMDHADIYGSYTCEENFGKAMAGRHQLRSKMQIVSKCGIKLVSLNRPVHTIHAYDTGKQHILQSVENSLVAMQTNYLDVLLIHRPDPLMNADEIAEAFRQLKDDGKVLHFGVSNFSASQFDLLQSRLDFTLVTNQIEVSVMKLDSFYDGVLDQCQQYRIKPMAWSPLAGGKLFNSNEIRAVRIREAINSILQNVGNYGLDQIALAWLLQHPSGIVPVIGSGNIDRIKKAVESEKIRLTGDQWFTILEASTGVEVP